MGIQRPEQARYNSLQEFIGFFKDADMHPATTNLFSVHFSTPPIIRENSRTTRFQTETGDLGLLLDYYAKTVNLPSKQITTGQTVNVGSGYKYSTGTAFSQISITFQMPRSQYTRALFERWTQLMANDGNQYTDYYLKYCCPELYIYKWERGGGDYAVTDPKLLRAVRQNGNNALLARKNKLTSVYVLKNVFPYNIGSIQLDNGPAKLMDLNVQFYYERYRFYPESSFDDTGVRQAITVPSSGDNTTDTSTPRNQTIPQRVGAGTQAELSQINSNIAR